MKRFFSATAATGIALSLLTAPLAMAQQAPQDHSDQNPPAAHAGPAHPAPTQHEQVQTHAQPQTHAQVQTHAQPQTHAQVQTQQPQRPQGQEHAAIAARPPVQQHVAQQSSHEWRHGDRYTGSRRVVSDWGHYHANPPPAGYEWVQDGNQLVLISITSGIIASVLANAVYQ